MNPRDHSHGPCFQVHVTYRNPHSTRRMVEFRNSSRSLFIVLELYDLEATLQTTPQGSLWVCLQTHSTDHLGPRLWCFTFSVTSSSHVNLQLGMLCSVTALGVEGRKESLCELSINVIKPSMQKISLLLPYCARPVYFSSKFQYKTLLLLP